jgi:hypothetical protein
MKRKILQSIADAIIYKLDTTKDENVFNFYIDMGLWLDEYCIYVHGIELK